MPARQTKKPAAKPATKASAPSAKKAPKRSSPAPAKQIDKEDVSNQALANRLEELEANFATHQHGKDGLVTLHQAPAQIVSSGKGDAKKRKGSDSGSDDTGT